MKKIIFNLCLSMLMLGAGSFVTSCSDDDNGPAYGAFSVDQTEITFSDNEADTTIVAVTSPSDWKVEVSEKWLKLPSGESAYGTPGNATNIFFYVEENTNEEERTAVITFTNLADLSQVITVKVVQPGHKPFQYADTNSAAPAGMQSNASKLMKEINAGWNLGNTMESDGTDETAWGNPMTTKTMIDGLKTQGFNAIRIPVRWYSRADADMNINAAWMARVKEVVDYAYNQGMYVILNSHHDNWYDRIVPGTLGETKTDILNKFSHMWTQIATTFKDYDEHLLLAGTNEVVYISQGKEEWGEPTNEDLFVYMNDLNQTFVDAVRATGGNNAWRTLVVQPWASNPEFALKHFVRPTDTVENRLMLEFHYYQPWNFCQQGGDDTKGENKYYWGAPYEDLPYSTNTENDIVKLFGDLKYNFVDKGIPVVMGEYGAVKHQKTSSNQVFGINYTKSEESRAYYLEFVVKQAKNHGFAAFFWDNNCIGTTGENFGLFDRNNNMLPYSEIAVRGILKGVQTGNYPF